ncbi:MAG: hypothetical protein IPJ19_14920 [Planctomycetes bacterium]|nr:hypothetical protein [Planctomycetota bacterium]
MKFALLALALASCSTSAPSPLAVQQAPAPEPAQASLYQGRIAPILAERCGTCHGPEKQKGKLALHTPPAILAGGSDGPVIVAGKPKQSELVRRLHLPLADEDHMPPENRPQPSAEEIAALENWIAQGAPFDGGTGAPVPKPAPQNQVTGPLVGPADPAALAALEQAFVHVEKADPTSGLLWVDFAANAPKWSDAELAKLLAPLAPQVAQLGLARTQAGAQTLALARRMPHLERLDLRGTGIADAALAPIAGHARLESLVLARAKLSDASVEVLLGLPKLARVYLWESGVTQAGLARLAQERPKLAIDSGDETNTTALEVEPEPKFTSEAPPPGAAAVPAGAPAAVAVASLEPINSVCPVSGAPVNKKYMIVFEGRVIGFCCNKCPGEFWADPEKFRSKLPAN